MNMHEGRNIKQIVGYFGDLRDESKAQEELRDYLAGCDIETLKRHAEECLKEKRFDERGFVLQDIVNTLAKHLDLEVEHGRYRGTQREDDNGVDGVWKTDDHDFVVEVKASIPYGVDLKAIGGYRDKLLQNQEIKKENNSLLLVIGNMGDGNKVDLEARIKGDLTRAGDTRIITVGSLIQLVELKMKDLPGLNPDYFCEILRPIDYIRVDDLVKLLANIVSDVTDAEEDDIQETEQKTKSIQKIDDSHRKGVLKTIEAMHGGSLVQNGRTRFENSKTRESFFISFSRNYGDEENAAYWYGYYYKFSNGSDFLALCTKEPKDWFYLIPTKIIEDLANEGKINFKDYDGFRRIHVHIGISNNQSKMRLKRGHGEEDIEQYKVSLTS